MEEENYGTQKITNSSIWQACDQLRGGMDASQYKDYVLVLLFVKYVSDKYAGKENALVVVPEGGSFSNLVKLKGKPKKQMALTLQGVGKELIMRIGQVEQVLHQS